MQQILIRLLVLIISFCVGLIPALCWQSRIDNQNVIGSSLKTNRQKPELLPTKKNIDQITVTGKLYNSPTGLCVHCVDESRDFYIGLKYEDSAYLDQSIKNQLNSIKQHRSEITNFKDENFIIIVQGYERLEGSGCGWEHLIIPTSILFISAF